MKLSEMHGTGRIIILIIFKFRSTSCCASSPLSVGGIEPPNKFTKMGGLHRISFLEGRCWERWGDSFRSGGGCGGVAVFV